VFASTICEPIVSSSSGVIAFTVAFVPTGMNTGVSISPRGVDNTPVRARDPASSHVVLNSKLIAIVSPGWQRVLHRLRGTKGKGRQSSTPQQSGSKLPHSKDGVPPSKDSRL
jgi:hypothetical protein